MGKAPGCKARQYSDQMSCSDCALTWDVNDPDPPMCAIKVTGNQQLGDIRERLAANPHHANELLTIKEMPFNALPTFGLQPGLRQVNWIIHPALRYCVVSRPMSSRSPNTRYTFYGETGDPLIEVNRCDDFSGGQTFVRHWQDGKPGEWQS